MRIWKKSVLFYLGGCAYMGLELLWRGRSHISMFFLGGLCFWLIGQMNRTHTAPVAIQAILGAAMVTALELLTGLVVNRWLGLGVVGVWWAMILDWIVRLSFFLYRWHRGAWQKTAMNALRR